MVIASMEANRRMLARAFNKSHCHGDLSKISTINIIIPIHKVGDPLEIANYHNIMVDHLMDKVHGLLLKICISKKNILKWHLSTRMGKLHMGHSTLEYIVTLCALETFKHSTTCMPYF